MSESAGGRGTYEQGSRAGKRKGKEGEEWVVGDSRRKLFLAWVLRGKHGNPVTREEGSALFKEARDISKFSPSSFLGLFYNTFARSHERDAQTRRTRAKTRSRITPGNLHFRSNCLFMAVPWRVKINHVMCTHYASLNEGSLTLTNYTICSL